MAVVEAVPAVVSVPVAAEVVAAVVIAAAVAVAAKVEEAAAVVIAAAAVVVAAAVAGKVSEYAAAELAPPPFQSVRRTIKHSLASSSPRGSADHSPLPGAPLLPGAAFRVRS